MSQKTITGKVSDDGGLPLIGANVLIKGTTTGTVTDLDGSFSINADMDFPITLEVSYTGFSDKEVTVTDGSALNIVLVEGILVDQVVVSASRKREKVQEAPASISVITTRKLATSPQATDPTRNLINTPGVQIQQQSANRINISMRGGAGLFGTSVLPIMDYRNLVGPGVGTFQSDQSGISTIDLARIEVVRGPGSALYGPGVTQGVVHFITKNPIDFPGTAVEVVGGELNTFGATARHATKVSDKFGFKINAHYRRGNEFTLDPNDPADSLHISSFTTTGISQPAVSGGVVDITQEPRELISQEDLDEDGDGNPMADDWYNFSANATLEFRPQDDLSIFVSGGYNEASSVFYNEQGEGLAQATEWWGQARVQKGGFFAQVFGVTNDGGDEDNPTFLYQTGLRSPVARNQFEGQAQYNFGTPSFLNADWTAGVDYRFVNQDTENLVYGRNEDDDDFSVVGGYVQGKFELTSKLDLVLAGRYDRFNFIDDGAFAPRAALVYKVDPKHTFRASFNRANSTVSNLQLNIDFPLAVLAPDFDIWLYGNKTTQTFNDPQTTWLISQQITGFDQMPLAVPYGAVGGDVAAGISAALLADPATAPLEPLVSGILAGVDPNQLGLFSGELGPGFNIFDGTPLGLVDAPISEIATDDVWEIGYKGLFNDKLGVTFDLYRVTQKNNSQFTAISPAYRLQDLDLIGGELGNAVAAQVEAPFIGGLVANGFPQEVAEQQWAAFAPLLIGAYAAGGQGFADAIDPLPFHATTPTDQVPDNGISHLSAGYRTFDERSFWGIDLGLEYYFSNDFSAFFNYSWVSDTEFTQNVVGIEGVSLPSYLNIPKNKFRLGVNYTPEKGIRGNISFQHDESYFSASGDFAGNTEERNLVDAAVGYSFGNGLSIDVSAQNVLDNEYRYLPNMPKIGRRTLGRLTYTFGAK
ncbi:MAG: TonB-dependent receptor [Bacteroidota bacterium]